MRTAKDIMLDLAASGLNPTQLVLMAELIGAVTADALRPPEETKDARARRLAAERQARSRDRRDQGASRSSVTMRDSSVTEQAVNGSVTSVTKRDDVTESHAALAHVRDITSNSELPGLAVVVAEARDSVTPDEWPEGDLAALLVAAVASPRLDPNKSPGLITTAGRIVAWKRDGASWQFDVLPAVQSAVRKTGPPIGTWKYFDQAVAQSIAANRQALNIPDTHELARRFPSAAASSRAASRGVWAEIAAQERGEDPSGLAATG